MNERKYGRIIDPYGKIGNDKNKSITLKFSSNPPQQLIVALRTEFSKCGFALRIKHDERTDRGLRRGIGLERGERVGLGGENNESGRERPFLRSLEGYLPFNLIGRERTGNARRGVIRGLPRSGVVSTEPICLRSKNIPPIYLLVVTGSPALTEWENPAEVLPGFVLGAPRPMALLQSDHSWQREMRDKFREQFEIIRGDVLRANYGTNPWQERDQVVTSISWISRIEDAKESLLRSRWDLIIVPFSAPAGWAVQFAPLRSGSRGCGCG